MLGDNVVSAVKNKNGTVTMTVDSTTENKFPTGMTRSDELRQIAIGKKNWPVFILNNLVFESRTPGFE